MFLQGKALRVQLDLRRYGPCWGPVEAVGKVPSAPHSRLLSPLQVSHLLQAVCAGVASGERTRASPRGGGPASLASTQPQHGAGLGRGCASQDTPSSPPSAKRRHALPRQAGLPLLPVCSPTFLSPQLFSLQAPLKTLLQLTIMPIINGRHHRCRHAAGLGAGAQWDLVSLHLSLPAERTKKGVQIPLPEGMDFTKEVVTNHAVRGRMGTSRAPPAGAGTLSCWGRVQLHPALR